MFLTPSNNVSASSLSLTDFSADTTDTSSHLALRRTKTDHHNHPSPNPDVSVGFLILALLAAK